MQYQPVVRSTWDRPRAPSGPSPGHQRDLMLARAWLFGGSKTPGPGTWDRPAMELSPSRARKPEIRTSKPETNPKHQAGNDQNHHTAGGFEPWTIGRLNLFRVSGFGFGTPAPGGSIQIRPPARRHSFFACRLGAAV